MNNKDYLNDIREIKQLMNRSSRFLSLSGLSGILAGIYALVGATIGYFFILPKSGDYLTVHSFNFRLMLTLLAGILILSVATAIFLTTQKAKKNGEKIWDSTTKKLLIAFLIPFTTGAIYILIKLNSQHYGLTASLMLIFYGLSLVNASKYTLGNIQYLGYAQLLLGLLCAILPGYGLWFWTAGFGICHIIYGIVMHFQEQKK